jgi:hypothetical protein
MFGTGAFFDLNTTGHQATLANDISVGEQCVVASVPDEGSVTFDWYSFTSVQFERDDEGERFRVFFGKSIKSEVLSRRAAIRDKLYSRFFDNLGRFKQQSVISHKVRFFVRHNLTTAYTRRLPRSLPCTLSGARVMLGLRRLCHEGE